MKKLLSALAAITLATWAYAQDKVTKPVEMADRMRSSGRIYVVIAVMLTILTGLIIYVVRIDRKISRWEKLEQKS